MIGSVRLEGWTLGNAFSLAASLGIYLSLIAFLASPIKCWWAFRVTLGVIVAACSAWVFRGSVLLQGAAPGATLRMGTGHCHRCVEPARYLQAATRSKRGAAICCGRGFQPTGCVVDLSSLLCDVSHSATVAHADLVSHVRLIGRSPSGHEGGTAWASDCALRSRSPGVLCPRTSGRDEEWDSLQNSHVPALREFARFATEASRKGHGMYVTF